MKTNNEQVIYLNRTDISWESRHSGIEFQEIDQPKQWVNLTNGKKSFIFVPFFFV